MVKYLVRTGKVSFWISGWGTRGRCRYSAVSLITRFDFMAPVTRVITALQCSDDHISRIDCTLNGEIRVDVSYLQTVTMNIDLSN